MAPDPTSDTPKPTTLGELRASGLAVTDRYPNRLVVGATGTVAAMERAFGVAIHVVEHRGLRHFAAMNDPSFPGELAASVTGVIGLDDLVERRPRVGAVEPAASLGTHCCASEYLLNDVLREQWGFDGIVVSDWYAAGDSVASASAGLTLEMPGPARLS